MIQMIDLSEVTKSEHQRPLHLPLESSQRQNIYVWFELLTSIVYLIYSKQSYFCPSVGQCSTMQLKALIDYPGCLLKVGIHQVDPESCSVSLLSLV